jgi:diaminohydroxyphosphoribosylaminopyrimidine deaminase / 5-amino-6-(5-phosphoribosylamino)uracil reductase
VITSIDSRSSLNTALQLAQSGRLSSPPNPAVGCVIVASDGTPLGQGHTQATGGPHAEIMALRDAQAQGHSLVGATAYVTLEPCSHHGRTGPCCDALVATGITKVVAAIADPNPLVGGQGFARLRAAGVQVHVLAVDDPLAVESRELNIGFFSRMVRKTPWVRLKMAASLDGHTALPNGTSQWITGAQARADGHAWRARACAVLTGIGTVLQDKPRLDVRLVETPRQPHLVVVDSQLQTPPNAPLFTKERAVFIYAAVENASRKSALEAAGATVIYMPALRTDANADIHHTPTGKVDLRAMLCDLAQREVNEVHVEAGHQLNGALVREGLVDELLVYLAPKLIGQGAGIADFGPLTELAHAVPLRFKHTAMVGPDLRVLSRVTGRDIF